MWVEHGRLIDIIFLLSHSRLDSKKLDIYHQIVHCGELKRQRFLTAGLDSAFVHEARDFDAGIVRKIGNEPPVYYIDRLSTHIASKGTKYRSHAATIYKWAQEDEAKKPPKKGIPDYTFKEGESL